MKPSISPVREEALHAVALASNPRLGVAERDHKGSSS
jgi:hypothetical protein